LKFQPFVKWAGGKSQLLEQFHKFYPQKFKNYIEPFVGSGAVFFNLFNLGLLKGKDVYLIDSNKDLMNLYQIIKNNVDDLINELRKNEYVYEKGRYYSTRKKHNREKLKYESIFNIDINKRVKLAARTLYLNRTCFNGLYRLNSKGEFNVPLGSYKNPTILDEDKLRNASFALKKVNVLCEDFEYVKKIAQEGDFIYLDPPYHPMSKTAHFTSYVEKPFLEDDQIRLQNCFRELDKKNCKLMQSNSDTKFINDLYKGYKIKKLSARRSINSKSDKRGKISELLILNY